MSEKSRFSAVPAARKQGRVSLALFGPSGSGKTLSALKLAYGIRSVVGGTVAVIDTENQRALDYADKFEPRFHWIDFQPPFGSLEYVDAFACAVATGASTIIIDSGSHEHESEGGMLDAHDNEVQRMAGNDYAKRERVKMLAWSLPKLHRRRLLGVLARSPVNLIMCFQAKEGSKPVDVTENGKRVSKVIQMGFVPIGGDRFLYEMKASCLLYPGSDGFPTWKSDMPGEKLMLKLPQYLSWLNDGKQLSEEHGRALAQWAQGGVAQGDAGASRSADARVVSTAGAASVHPPATTSRSDEEAEPCWEPVAGGSGKCKLVKGHDGRHVPEPPQRAQEIP